MKKNKKIAAAVIGAVFLVGGLVAGFVAGWGSSESSYPDIDVNEPNNIREFVESEEFREMDESQRREFFRETMRKAIVSRADEYVKLPEDRKTEYLDNIINQMQNRMRRFRDERERTPADDNSPRPPRRDPEDGDRRRGPRGPMDASRMRGRFESMDATVRAKITQFMMDLHRRMQQRGITPR